MTSDAGEVRLRTAAVQVSCQPPTGWRRLLTIDVRARARTSIVSRSACRGGPGDFGIVEDSVNDAEVFPGSLVAGESCLCDSSPVTTQRLTNDHGQVVSLVVIVGKQIRTKLSQAFNHWLNVPEDKTQGKRRNWTPRPFWIRACCREEEVIIEVTEMLHNASLLIDDIEDNSKLRRGFPVAHSIYGVPSVINSANYVYFLGLEEKVLTLNHPQAVHVFTQQLLELHRGQGLDIYWRDTYTCPTEAEYKAMVLQKTGGLFGLAIGLMQLFSSYDKDLKPLLNTLGLFFQIRDDYANLHSKEYTENKSFCEDLTEGKFSFPTIHAIWSRPESTQVQNILRQRTENVDIKKYCVHYLEKVGSFEYTKQTLRELENEAYGHIRSLGGNPELISIIEQLSSMYKNPS
ncbi:unnamed protein product [Ranitomeya imitator]|uniref:Geranylgeranyl diphosphate synthase 1 n=1 Tax=Ranitomeya imitator TaxID=111125 RepID=A0ABN9MAF5_9NEOB|nr:unnamed protein product [Ranitomeya imitator]